MAAHLHTAASTTMELSIVQGSVDITGPAKLKPRKYKKLLSKEDRMKERRHQVRQAQNRHRQRKADYIKQLETGIIQLRASIAAERDELDALRNENEQLELTLTSRTKVPASSCPAPSSSSSSEQPITVTITYTAKLTSNNPLQPFELVDYKITGPIATKAQFSALGLVGFPGTRSNAGQNDYFGNINCIGQRHQGDVDRLS